MSIRNKIIILLLITVVLLTAGIYIPTRIILIGNIEKQEVQEAGEEAGKAIKLIDKDISQLNSSCGDWSAWDDTYRFIVDKNENYLKSNLVDGTFTSLNLNMIVYINLSSEIVYKEAFDLGKNSEVPFPDEFYDYVYKTSPLLARDDPKGIVSGIIMIGSRPMLFSARPITDSNGVDPVRGTLVMGRFIGMNQLKELEEITGSKITISDFNGSSDLTTAGYTHEYITDDADAFIKPISSNVLECRVLLKDIYKKDAIVLTLHFPRLMHQESYQALKIFLYSSFACFLLIMLHGTFATQAFFVSRIEKLNNFINKISLNKNTSDRLQIKGRDEIANLSKAVNQMLEEIDKSNKMLRENEERLTLVIEGSSDGFWDINTKNEQSYISHHLMFMLGYSPEHFSGSIVELAQKLVHPDDFNRIKSVFYELPRREDSGLREEIRVLSESGDWRWMLVKGKIVEWDTDGKPLRMAGTISDVTDQRKSEEAIRYLSYHDTLTGLYNRTYFLKELERINRDNILPCSIIMGDVNGLKLTNDAFGHKEGDMLLVKIAEILNKSCGEKDTVARLGGDEFVIILPGADEERASRVCESIKTFCREYSDKLIKPSMALGEATKTKNEEDIQKLLETAEDRMYKNKLLEDKSSRHSIIASMERSLLETDYETEEHAQRLQQLSTKLGKYLRLSPNAMDELSVLSRLHDIGKIAIPKEILSKSTPLTSEEWEVIKKHTEIGYRIALSSNDLIYIADSILAHHEKWDGSGYPKGLRGTEIPLSSRIISIVDAYDVITHSRPYKKAYTHQEAIEEIKRCSGTHFDPELARVFIEMFEKENAEPRESL